MIELDKRKIKGEIRKGKIALCSENLVYEDNAFG
jgi:hypothetical protein